MGAFQRSEMAYGRTSHFDNEISFYLEFLEKNHVLHAYYVGFD